MAGIDETSDLEELLSEGFKLAYTKNKLALETIEGAASLARSQANIRYYALALLAKSNYYGYVLNDTSQAFKICTEAKQWIDENDISLMAHYEASVGMIHHLLGHAQLAQKNYISAIKYFERIEHKNKFDIERLPGVYFNSYILFGYTQTDGVFGNIEQLNKAIELYGLANNKRGMMMCYTAMANHYDNHKQPIRKSLEMILKSCQLAAEVNDPTLVAITYSLSGIFHTRAALYSEAETYFEKADRELSLAHHPLYEAMLLHNKGHAFLFTNKFEQAIDELKKAEEIYVGLAARAEYTKVYELLATAYSGIGAYKEAFEYERKYRQLMMEDIATEKLNALASAKSEYETEIKIQESRLLRDKTKEVETYARKLEVEKEEAERQRRRAEQSEQFKQMFLANMSHEIRTPMNAIVGMANLLLAEAQNKKNLHYLNIIKQSSDHLLVIINDVLDLSKIESGKLTIERVPFDLKVQLELLSQMFKLKVEEKNIELQISYGKKLPPALYGDPYRLTQVLINLLGNAIKFTQKGRVALDVTRTEGDQYQFTVRDTGIGIAPDKLDSIFESFTQAESATTRQYGGTGLGLTISQKIVELMGSKITVSSEAGKGSEFSFTLELKPGNASDLAIAKSMAQPLPKQFKGIRILLAEDNNYNQIVAIETLKKFMPQSEVTLANTGKEVLQKLKAADFDIILMDIHMPQMDGYEASRTIRRDFEGGKKQIPILALTASVVRADIELCMQSGMNGYVPKPFSPDELIREIHKHLAHKSVEPAKAKAPVAKTKKAVKSKTIDTSYIEEFTEGDVKNIKKYIGLFLRSAPAQLKKAESAVKKNDSGALYAALHTLKPQLRFMGLPATLTKTEQLETKLRAGAKVDSHVAQAVQNLNQEITAALEEWKLYKSRLSA